MVTEDAQAGAFDKTIEDPEIEDAVATLIDAKRYMKDHKVGKARKAVKSLVEQYELEDGQRIRVGGFVITTKSSAGGGFEVPTWEKTTIGTMGPIDDE